MSRFTLTLVLSSLTVLAIGSFAMAGPDEPEPYMDQSLVVRKAGPWPRLILNNDPAVCSGYLQAMQASFESNDHHVTLRGGLAAWSGARSLFDIEPYTDDVPRGARQFLTRAPGPRYRGAAAVLKADLDLSGTEEALLFTWGNSSWRGYTYSLQVFSSSQIRDVEAALSLPGDDWTHHLPKGVNALHGTSSWLPPTVVEAPNGAVYQDRHQSAYFKPDGRLYRITPTGSKVVCRVQVYPESWMGPATDRLFRRLRQAQGEECDGGTLRPLTTLQLSNVVSRLNFAVRHWALPEPYNDPDVLWTSLERWSYTDPWSRRVYLDIVEDYPLALRETAARLVREHEVPANSRELHALAIDRLWRIVGAHYVFSENGFDLDRMGIDSLSVALYRDVRNAADLDEVFSDPDIDLGKPDYLFAFVDRPELLEHLVTLGANVDVSNSYGKTALMYAAQLDHTETVAGLIGMGAGMNRRTHGASGGSPCLGLEVTGRTALTYAAENASFETIRLLLDAGADGTAKLGDRPISELLADNTRLSTDQRAELTGLLGAD